MTEQPIAPAPAAAAPGAPAPAPTPTTTAPAQPAPPAQQTPSATDPAARIAELEAALEQQKGYSRTWEARAKANTASKEQLAKVAQALGIEGAQPDPAQIAAQLQAAQAASLQAARELAVLRVAAAAGADGDALLDSRTFAGQLANLDPNDAAAVKAAVTAAVAANPKFALKAAAPAAPAAPTASTATDFNGAPGAARQWTAEDVKRATPEQTQKALAAGLLRDYMNS